MNLKVCNCPACGYGLNIQGNEEYVTCPSCGSRIRIEQERGQTGDGRSFFKDNSGQVIAVAKVPKEFVTMGEIIATSQSIAKQIMAKVEALHRHKKIKLFANSGESFRQVKKGIMQYHVEGQIDPQTRAPMRTFKGPRAFVDEMAIAFNQNQPLKDLGTYPLMRECLKNVEATRRQFYNEALAEMGAVQAQGVNIDIHNVFVGGLTRAYSFTQGGEERILILGVELRGLEYSLNAPGMFFGGIGALFGGMMNNQQQQQSFGAYPFGQAPSGGIASYVDWDSCGVYGMIAEGPFSQEYLDIFNDFVNTFELNPAFEQRMKELSKRTTDAMMQQQQRNFAAQQQAHRTMQEAYDMQNQAWWDRTNAQDNARRMRQAQMNSSEHHADFSEAIRGVNVYERPDGSEVEYSVSADRVFMKNGDDLTMRGASVGEDVPFGWTELHRK